MMRYIFFLLFAFAQSLVFCSNHETLNSYEKSFQKYIEKTPHEVNGDCRAWIEQFLSLIPNDKIIFEIGSAFGRDAIFIESFGYKIQRSDATQQFVKHLNEQGFSCLGFNVLVDDFKSIISACFANAVFLHFNKDEFKYVLDKIHQNLEADGILAFSVKYGFGEGWETEKLGEKRFFYYWQPDDLKNQLQESNFSVVYLEQDVNKKWIYVIAKKN